MAVILGLLMSLVAPTMFSKVGSAKAKTAKAQMQMLETALDTYRLDLGDYPKTLNELFVSPKTKSASGFILFKISYDLDIILPKVSPKFCEATSKK